MSIVQVANVHDMAAVVHNQNDSPFFCLPRDLQICIIARSHLPDVLLFAISCKKGGGVVKEAIATNSKLCSQLFSQAINSPFKYVSFTIRFLGSCDSKVETTWQLHILAIPKMDLVKQAIEKFPKVTSVDFSKVPALLVRRVLKVLPASVKVEMPPVQILPSQEELLRLE